MRSRKMSARGSPREIPGIGVRQRVGGSTLHAECARWRCMTHLAWAGVGTGWAWGGGVAIFSCFVRKGSSAVTFGLAWQSPYLRASSPVAAYLRSSGAGLGLLRAPIGFAGAGGAALAPRRLRARLRALSAAPARSRSSVRVASRGRRCVCLRGARGRRSLGSVCPGPRALTLPGGGRATGCPPRARCRITHEIKRTSCC